MRLEDEPFWKRAAIAIIIVLALLFILLVISYFETGPTTAQQPTQLYAGIALDEHLLEIDRRALSEAYHQQVVLLFTVWLKDAAGDATRFRNGLRIARRAYGEAAEQIERREREIRERR